MNNIFFAIIAIIFSNVSLAQNGLTLSEKLRDCKPKDQNGKTITLKDALNTAKLLFFFIGAFVVLIAAAL